MAYDLVNSKSRHITFITRRTTILTIGFNDPYDSHTLARRFEYWDDRIHSELDAIIKFSKKNIPLRNCKIWNVRIDRWNKVKLSKPCIRCQKLLKSYGATKIYYTNSENNFESLIKQ